MFLQLSGDGREERPQWQLTDCLIVATILDAGSASGVDQLRQELRAKHRLRGKSIAMERLHVTLHHVGDFAGLSEGIVAKAHTIASAVSLRPFPVEFNCPLNLPRQTGNSPLL